MVWQTRQDIEQVDLQQDKPSHGIWLHYVLLLNYYSYSNMCFCWHAVCGEFLGRLCSKGCHQVKTLTMPRVPFPLALVLGLFSLQSWLEKAEMANVIVLAFSRRLVCPSLGAGLCALVDVIWWALEIVPTQSSYKVLQALFKGSCKWTRLHLVFVYVRQGGYMLMHQTFTSLISHFF